MKTRMIIFGVLLVVVAVGAVLLRSRQTATPETTGAVEQAPDIYTCPMHPSVISDHPGACPVCGMALVRKSAVTQLSDSLVHELRSVSLSPTQQVLANVATVQVARRTIALTIGAVGTIDYAEPRFAHITARFPGRIEKLHVSYTGQYMKKGDPVVDLYSPDLVTAQQEYLVALGTGFAGPDTPGVASLRETARRKLLLWGITDRQIDDLDATRTIRDVVTVFAPIGGTVLKKNADLQQYVTTGENLFDIADLSFVWAYLDVYEKDIRFIRNGDPVDVTVEAYPGERFAGYVRFIDPVVNPETRVIRVRAEFPNSDGRLRPNMYVNAGIVRSLHNRLAVPTTAILSTGRENVVWVAIREGVFGPRTITAGASADGYTEILSGLQEGEEVASSGGYLIDSESALQLPAMAQMDGSVSPAGTDTAAIPLENPARHADGIREIDIRVKGTYAPAVIRLNRGEPVRLRFHREETAACTEEVVIEKFHIRRKLPAFATTTIELTPAETGEFRFSCGMHMVHGTIMVSEGRKR